VRRSWTGRDAQVRRFKRFRFIDRDLIVPMDDHFGPEHHERLH
jgi:hypothetical protein